MWWVIGLVCNALVAVAYMLIVIAIVVPLVQGGQLRSNPLGAATAAIFFTCAIHHGGHSVHMLLPYAGVETARGEALRYSFDWEAAAWDIITAAVGAYYWTLRRNYGSLMRGAKLFEDMRQREQQALELNDNVLQGLVVARMALDLDQPARAKEALATAIGSASHMITDLLGPEGRSPQLGLLRSTAADVSGAGSGADTGTQPADADRHPNPRVPSQFAPESPAPQPEPERQLPKRP